MKYVEALKLIQSNAASEHRLVRVAVLSNYLMDQLATFLQAHGVQDGVWYQVKQSRYQSLRDELFTISGGEPSDALVLVLMTEDVFPEVGYRTTTLWSEERISQMLDEADARIAETVEGIERLLEPFTGRVFLVPPILEVVPLFPNPPGLMSASQYLSLWIQSRFATWAVRRRDVMVVNPADLFDGIPQAELRNDKLLLQAGSPFSLSAADRIASIIHQNVGAIRDSKKLLITDLDNTLWSGVIGEDGPAGISSHPDGDGYRHYIYQNFLGILRSQGVVLAICSKNNPEDVDGFLTNPALLEQAGVRSARDDFAWISCSWSPKSEQIRNICNNLGILPESAVFIDDNPLELIEVQKELPGVTCLRFPTGEVHVFLKQVRELFFAGAMTTEDRLRTDLYRLRQEVEAARSQFDSPEQYLRYLQMQARFRPVDTSLAERPLQLVNKTNQFNLTGKRYSPSEWASFLSESGCHIVQGSLNDRYGDHGVVLVALVREEGDDLFLEQMVLSCRVFNRGMETAFLDWLAGMFRPGARRVRAKWQPTGKNEPSRDYFTRHGFREVSHTDSEVQYITERLCFGNHFLNLV